MADLVQPGTGRLALSMLCACFFVSCAAEMTHTRCVVSAGVKPIGPFRALRGGEDPAYTAAPPEHLGSAVKLRFSVECPETMLDETVAIVGSVSELGSWSNFIPMCPKVRKQPA